MAKKKGRSSVVKKPVRDVRLTGRVIPQNTRRSLHRTNLTSITDNRLFSPLPLVFRPIQTVQGRPAKVYRKVPRKGPISVMYAPKNAVLCARRKIRKEVLHAKGRSGAGNRKPRYGQNSQVKCKR